MDIADKMQWQAELYGDEHPGSMIEEGVAEITRLRARLDEAAKILALFAEEAVRYEPDEGDGDDTLWDKTGCLRIKHLRAAAQWMKENKPCASGK
jgi:hypothetical protein